jgi:hypothetical protein
MKNELSRDDFVRLTVSQTISEYMRRYCAPWSIEQAQTKCVQDAEALADRLYGAVEMPMAISPALPQPRKIRRLR